MKFAMRVLCAMGFGLFALVGALITSGCQQYDLDLPAGEDSDLTVDQLVSKMSKATDPQGNFKNAKSYILKQKVIDSGKFERDEYSLEIRYKAPNFMKYTSYRGGKPFSILIFNGERAWNIDPETSLATEVSSGKGINLVKTFAALAKPGNTPKTVFKDVEIDMVRDQWDILCYRLVCRVEDSSIAPYIMLIDSRNYLTRSFETTLYGSDGSIGKYYSAIGKYDMVAGICMASETLVENGDKKVRSNLISFTLDPVISDDEFKLPEPFFHKESKNQEQLESIPAK